jgi:RND superfamily putative drug exporter
VVLVATTLLGGRFGGGDSTDYGTPGSESAAATDLLDQRFPARSGDTIDVVWRASDVTAPAVRTRVGALLDQAAALDHVVAVTSPYAPGGERQVAADSTVAYATLQLDTWDMPIDVTQMLLDATAAARNDEIDIELGGQGVQNAEQGAVGAEGIGFLAAALILLVSFGSLLAMGLPITTAVFGIGVSSGLIALLANLVDVPDWATSVAAMIAIGVGIDYSLLIVTRYRTALHDGLDPRRAVAEAVSTAGRSVLFAGTTVMISLLGMVVMRLPYLHGVAFGSAMAVGVMMALSVTLLPAVLGFVGHTIDRLHVPFVGRTARPRSLSFRWSRVVQRRPWYAALGGLIVLLALATPALGLRLGFPDAGNGPDSLTSRRAYDLLSEGFGPGFNGTLLVVADLSAGGTSHDLDLLHTRLVATDGVAAVGPITMNLTGDTAVIPVAPTTAPQADETQALLRTVRDEVIPAAVNETGVTVYVGGLTAAFLDQTDVIADHLPLFIAAVVGLSLILLLIVFRSVLVAIKAGLMNLLSVLAAYGVITIAADGGWFGDLIGIHAPTPVPSFIPMMMFAVLFGLSMDYEVFLLSRVREEYERTGDNAGAVADGLAATARVITAAAAIMVAVFVAFVPGDQVFLKLIGIGMATAIFVDATIVRMVLVPATMELLGDRNWWLPRWLDRLLPRVNVDDQAPTVPSPSTSSLDDADRLVA